ncbi:MAG: AraC family transcriptional regulator [Alphaproteobacteria bacterium]|jgi:predicted transcriptional regulator YdeE|nr:GyrI-like domain-containing protein [Rickettsiaceae bacterium]NBY34816.1 AraC family transcriptional regulator [Alphaproteobacteria bacterium]UCM94470.1 MAG: GyrI-like domain-containing protein [Candidatus Megaira endosymbiont of Mesostigma viride]HJK88666.1 GyrI-like domain-containing protein [Candidatus Megaira endosymbiont of Mesostigma viride]
MQKTVTELPEIKLLGILCRTNNTAEMNISSAKIAPTIQKYFRQAVGEEIPNRKNPGTTYCVYTDYESDFTGDYTYFIGEEVKFVGDSMEGFSSIIIPAQNYAKFTSKPGIMPEVCIDMWQNIWKMKSGELGGKRAYLADFEVYDKRALDPSKTVLDIYVGVK